MQCKCDKVYKGYIEFDTTLKARKDKNLFPKKESVKNADLHEPVLNKIITTHE